MARAIEIASLGGSPVRDRLVERFHADHYPLYREIARRFRARSGVPASMHDDAVQIVAQRADQLLSSLSRSEATESFARILQRRAWSHLRDWSYSGERTGVAGGSGAARRSVVARQTARKLEARLGRFPTAEEIIEAANDEMTSRLSNPRKAGMTFTDRDVDGLAVSPSDQLPEPGSVDERPPLEAHEMDVLVDAAVQAASANDPRVGRLAAAYLRCYTEGDGTVVTSQLARHVGRSPDWVRRALPEVHRVCRDVLADAFGIRGLGDVT